MAKLTIGNVVIEHAHRDTDGDMFCDTRVFEHGSHKLGKRRKNLELEDARLVVTARYVLLHLPRLCGAST